MLFFRVHEGVCQHAVVRHKQKALGVIIQPPDRIHALRYVRDELRDGTPALSSCIVVTKPRGLQSIR